MRILTVVGARPQFIKASPVSNAIRAAGHDEVLVHTGQHYDDAMSSVFFRELDMAPPGYNLDVRSGPHGQQTGRMLERIEGVIMEERPDWVLVYGDTNSTLAGALAAVKLRVPLAHVEAGLRSFNADMPEEHNRIVTDHCADLLLCPTQVAVSNLAREGITSGVHLVGDTMYDAVVQHAAAATASSALLGDLGLRTGDYALATIHRPSNTDDLRALTSIIHALADLPTPVVFPAHPRTRGRVNEIVLSLTAAKRERIRIIDPVGYLDMLALISGAARVFTDSGGVQKEAYFLKVPCVTLREETEWSETVDAGWNVLTGADPARIREAARRARPSASAGDGLFGDGHAAQRIVKAIAGGGRRARP